MVLLDSRAFKNLACKQDEPMLSLTIVQFSLSSVIDSAVCSPFISVQESLRMPNRVSSALVAALVFISCSAWLASFAVAQRPITADDYFHIHEAHHPELC